MDIKMKRKWFIILGGICALLAAVILTGRFAQPNNSREEMIYVANMGEFASEDGFYYLNNDRFLQFYDYQMRKNAIVCSKPN